MQEFDSHGMKGGVWSGLLRDDAQPHRVVLQLGGNDIAEARVSAGDAGGWLVEASLPLDSLSDGMQLYQLVAEGASGARAVLASLPLLAGAQLEDDLRAEMALLRAEMELMKREFRRLAAGR